MADEWDAREAGAALLHAVTRAISVERAAAKAAGRDPSSADLARAVLRSPALQDANRELLDSLESEYKPKIAALVAAEAVPIAEAAATAERERIRQLADRTGAVCPGDDGTSCFFSALLEPAGRSDEEAASPVAAELDGQLPLPGTEPG